MLIKFLIIARDDPIIIARGIFVTVTEVVARREARANVTG
jgi:hypothetical protein